MKENEKSEQLGHLTLNALNNFHLPDPPYLSASEENSLFFGVDNFNKRYGGEYFNRVQVEQAIRRKEKLNKLRIDELALELVLEDIVLKDYSKKLKPKTVQEIEDEINNIGRPDDPSAPQEPIQNYIQGLIRKAQQNEKEYLKYWHFTGAHKGRPNKSQIVDELMKTKLIGELSKETVKDRVNRALSYLGY
ncbi:MAG: hypothetical protein JXR20_06285 [Balneola sp.]